MSNNVMISFLGENKPNLISDVTTYLTEQAEVLRSHLCHIGKSMRTNNGLPNGQR